MKRFTLYVANNTVDLENALTHAYGGLTVLRGTGTWIDADKALYREPTNVLTVFADEGRTDFAASFDKLVALHTKERAYVLEGPTDAEIRFVEYLR